MTWKATKPVTLKRVIQEEGQALAARRKKLGLPVPKDDLLGIALSGGGIRSATVCLGVLETFNSYGLLRMADYLSSVSGGGYTASYVQATLSRHNSSPDAFEHLFTDTDISHLRDYGAYLAPGKHWLTKALNYLKLGGAYVYSFMMNLVWVLTLFVTIGAMTSCLYRATDKLHVGEFFLWTAIFVFAVHFFLHVFRFCCWSSRVLYWIEGIIFAFALFWGLAKVFTAYVSNNGIFTRFLYGCSCTDGAATWLDSFLSCNNCFASILVFSTILLTTGFFANPNILTFHRFYRDSLAAAYLSLVRDVDRAFRLKDLNPGDKAEDWGSVPYPLINTCLNLQGRNDKNFAGTSTCEHFILSPLYCGSKLTGYAPSQGDAYTRMTLATAMAISGAAVNPEMGYKSNRFMAALMTIMNLRLGYWAPNPSARLLPRLTWWPWYHIREMLSKTDTTCRRVLLSDGGHVENLGIFELLRRRCRLIVSVDAGADPEFSFSDLQELIIQARNILGVEIKFRNRPEDVIRPEPSRGYSQEHYAIADISVLPDVTGHLEGYRGVLVYLKSSLKAPLQVKDHRSPSYLYKTYHPSFPHEPTSDQFFDAPQWDAYHTLGKNMADDLLRGVLGHEPDLRVKREMTATQWCELFESTRKNGEK